MAELILIADELRSGGFRLRQAHGLVVQGARIAAVGPADPLLALKRPGTRLLRLPGVLLPGFVDAHLHFRALVRRRTGVDCASARGAADLLRRLRRAAAGGSGWIFAHGLEHRRPGFGPLPELAALDRAAGGRPLWLRHRSGHLDVLNTAALRALGLPDAAPPEAWLERRDGQPTGAAHGLGAWIGRRLREVQPAPAEADVAAVAGGLLRQGVTAFADLTPSNRPADLPAWAGHPAAGRLPQAVRLWVDPATAPDEPPDPDDRDLAVAGWKVVLHRRRGGVTPGPEALARTLARAGAGGWPVAVHAVEADALAVLLEGLRRAGQAGPLPPLVRAEHCNAVPPGLERALGEAGVAVCVQPGMLRAQGPVYREIVPPAERGWLFPLRRLARHVPALALGSDAPAGPPEPLRGVAMAVARRDVAGCSWGATERLSPTAALRAATATAAALSGFARVGTLEPGARADALWFREGWEALLESLREGEPPRPAGTLVAGRWHGWD